MFATGGTFGAPPETMTMTVFVLTPPCASVTVKLTGYVPGKAYDFDAVTPVPTVPSPKFHA